MPGHQVIFFTPYPFTPGQKIRITAGPRRGDWEVAAIDEQKVTLRCPVSGRQFSWNHFCYQSESRINEPWPIT
ncbi:hypothetical protein [Desulfurivibrio alkaliphilus]|uniref:Uncharacterized protein n=1 Tax=Desulfurivibrio alkaliphilus (strain DSM 19089 / UNIQEM U267 / AHT2) TaxID=589865 RepID=D6Z5E4_DESAT|nr:hypothetical protein [Desulfurivibrio alkaliphilus]ADH84801.1 conserved hypothetical protein [Desulfurivibrio alkaliphilus AHT 2]